MFQSLLLIAFGVGAFLRWQQLPAQWLTDDEWHVVHKILSGAGYVDIALSVGIADFSVPQALLYKWLAATTGIDELGMRLPMWVAGVALVGVGGWWARRNCGPAVAWGFALLLALSPLLVTFSRTARPYAITVLLAWAALLALERWRRDRDSMAASAFAVSTVLACWLHMAVAPFVLAPLGWVLVLDIWAGWKSGSWRRLSGSALLALPVVVGVAVLALVPMILSQAALATRMGADLPTLGTLIGIWFVWFGTDSPWVVAACLGLALLGLPRLAAMRPGLLVLVLIGVLAMLASVIVTRPAWVHNPLTLARYLLPVLPVLLLCVALGLVRGARNLPWPWMRFWVPIIMPVFVLVGSPTLALLVTPNNFTLHSWYQFDYREAHNPVRTLFGQLHESPFWQQLADAPPGSVHVAVAGHGLESFTLLDVRWQQTHRQPLWSAQRIGYCGAPPYWGEVSAVSGFHLRNVVYLDSLKSMRDAEIDYVVFNRALGLHDKADIVMPDIEPCIERFARDHGAPVYADEDLVAFRMTYKG